MTGLWLCDGSLGSPRFGPTLRSARGVLSSCLTGGGSFGQVRRKLLIAGARGAAPRQEGPTRDERAGRQLLALWLLGKERACQRPPPPPLTTRVALPRKRRRHKEENT